MSSSYICPALQSAVADTKAADAIDTTMVYDKGQTRVRIWSEKQAGYNHTVLHQYVRSLIQWIRSMQWSVYDPNKRWNVTLYLTALEKQWCPSSGSEIGICNANGGETHFKSPVELDIVVARAQDCFQVVIHELLHACGWDHLCFEHLSKPVGERFHNEREGVIEAVSRILHCVWLSGPTEWYTMLQREQASALETARRLRTQQWTTVTNVWAYYFVSPALLHSLEIFVNWVWPPLASDYTWESRQAAWPRVRDMCWAALFPDPTTSTFWTRAPRTNGCISLRRTVHTVRDMSPRSPAITGGATSSRRRRRIRK